VSPDDVTPISASPLAVSFVVPVSSVSYGKPSQIQINWWARGHPDYWSTNLRTQINLKFNDIESVDKVALGKVFSEYFGFLSQSSFHQFLHNHHHLSSGAGTIGQ
jgi:hypothetical protein